MTIRSDQGYGLPYVMHWKHSYSILRARLCKVHASELSYRVFYCLAADIDLSKHLGGNAVEFSIPDLMYRFSLGKSAIYNAVHALKEADVARKKRKNVLLLDPWLCFAGSVEDHKAAVHDWYGWPFGYED